MAFIDEYRERSKELMARVYNSHNEQRAKLFEVYGLIEQLVKDDKGERIVELCRHLDDIAADYSSRGNLTYIPLIALFERLIKMDVKGYKLLSVINYSGRDAIDLAKVALQEPDHFKLMARDALLTPEQIKEQANKSLQDCLEVI